MKRIGWLSILLLALYASVVFAADIHVHAGKDQSALHCQLCQISNLSVTQTVSLHASPGVIELGILSEARQFFVVPTETSVSFGRAPPLS